MIVCVRIFLVCLVSMLAVWACDKPMRDPVAWDSAAAGVATIQVTPTFTRLEIGQKQQLLATLGDAAGNRLPLRMAKPALKVGQGKQPTAVIGDKMGRTGRIVTWRSNQPALVSVAPNGLVTALAVGEAEITADSEGRIATVKIVVTRPPMAPISVMPDRVDLSVGETLQFRAVLQDAGGNRAAGPIVWRSDQTARATVNRNGLAKAIAPGLVTITATHDGHTGTAVVKIAPSKKIHGLNFPGNAGVHTTMRFEFAMPMAAYPATYIWRVYPRQQQSYYTAFFWGNNGNFYPSRTYYGFHPYPDWKTAYQHYWEIAAAPGGDFASQTHVVYDRWYIQVAVCRKSGDSTVNEFYWDWPDTTKVVRHTGKQYDDPPVPVLVIGDAPWNHGNEVWDGVLRGFQFYDTALTQKEIEQEIALPGAARKPWYLNLNPTPMDISDKSGSGHHPAWVGIERPSKWTGTLVGETIVRTAVAPQ